MAQILTSLTQIAGFDFDDIIDVRAPQEFAEDHIPGALNLPVLDDLQRAEVGTIYKQISPFTARKVGAALVAHNSAKHLQGPLADKPGNWRPLVYCWRGGQRSGSFASILSQIGWRVELVQGGYKAWRALVVDALYEQPFPARIVVLDGNTGSGKTDLLLRLAARGVQMIDLEGLARHRGSLFGAMPGGQPSQKAFESALAMQMAGLDPARVVVVEAESSKVGNCRLPPGLWKSMRAAPRFAVAATAGARAAYLTRAYSDLTEDRTRLANVIGQLAEMQPRDTILAWQAMVQSGDFTTLARELMEQHYDPRYERHRTHMDQPVTEFATDTLEEADLEALADRLAAAL